MAQENQSAAAAPQPEDVVVDSFSVRAQHVRLTQVVLRDQTDACNEIVQERDWLLHSAECGLALQGNLFVIEDTLTGAGRILVNEAPLPHARPVACVADLRIKPRGDSGFDFEMLAAKADAGSFPFLQIPYEGGLIGRTKAMQAYQRSKRPNTPPHRTPRFISNTWGDRSQDSRVKEEFLMKEIDAAVRLGVEVVQIDDGWQAGISSNSVHAGKRGGIWQGFWNADPNFWQPHPEKFPRGLEPVIAHAKKNGVQIGLWYVPDTWDNCSQWEKDVACLIGLHRKYGVEHFKIDGVNFHHPVAQANLRKLFDALLRESHGRIALDLDVTAQNRPGYFGAIPVGPLFIENRYTDWHRYWPHHTLRNLWKLARWVDAGRLRMELLNNTRNQQNYPDDPLAPVHYSPDVLFATVMFSNPLGWFEVSNLPPAYFEKVPSLVAIWKQHRAAMFGGTIIPVGAAPDGVSWTGIISLGDSGRDGYVLAFRELNADACWPIEIPGRPAGRVECELLAGNGELTGSASSILAQVNDPLGFVFGRFRVS